MPAYLTPLVVTSLATLIAATLAAIAFSDRLGRGTRLNAVRWLGGLYAVWFPVMIWLAMDEVFVPSAAEVSLVLPLAILGPPLTLLAALALSPALRRVAGGLSQEWLVGIQMLRVMGGVFVLVWAGGAIPWEFALPAGLGDVVVGLIAMVALSRLRAGAANAGVWVRRTNIAGLADFAVAVGTGFLSAPGAIQLLALDRPNELINLYPLVLIPVFAVPVFIAVHLLSIRLHLARRAEAGGDPVPA
jgi:hypothetical protein